ncbi:hypothetical protein DPMN_101995 [Dreissena polymorpha]|uniref:Tyrosinase copper-binding domain-containing protein n=1 Tax=Dreissena polymorpha TaxID=45954 RepID=A0A9D4RA75_DREPO|nr:hypothetical protein DPMN_101995 [Dreissena polymorpha]
MGFLQEITVVLCVLVITHADPLGNFLPQELAVCVNRLTPLANAAFPTASDPVLNIRQRENGGQQAGVEIGIDYAENDVPRLETPEDVHLYCVKQFVWKADTVRWKDYNITETDQNFINGLLESMMTPTGTNQSSSKRQAGGPGGLFPPTGFRVRQEIRRISDGSRNAFFGVLRAMKMNGEYDMFARLHRGIVEVSAHQGPNFYGWHRVLISMFEEAMRRIDRRVSLPYWDSTLDFEMDNPVHTILFSPAFYGNGDGLVTTGPFANWATPIGPLTRNIGSESSLMSKRNIQAVMSRCRMIEISRPTAAEEFDLELFHGGNHLWVDGQFSDLAVAAYDPLFWIHHAFVDYIWEMFRFHQFFDCRVNPDFDYPDTPGLHTALRQMDGLPGYVNIDGYRGYWTRFWYRYERAPMCPCGSPYLRCHPVRGVCVSIERFLAPDEGPLGPYGAMAYPTSSRAARARAQVAMLGVGRKFDAPSHDPRTQMYHESMGRKGAFKRTNMAPVPAVGENSNQQNIVQPHVIGDQILTAVSNGRKSDALERNNASPLFTGQNANKALQDIYSGHAFPVAEPTSLLPVPVWDTLDSYLENRNSYTSNSSAYDWLFVPVQVTFNAVGVDNSARTPSMKCLPSDAKSTHIKVSVQGINYLGENTDYAVVDISKDLDSSHAIVAIRAPVVGPSMSMLTASHGCGLMCKPMCINTKAGTLQYHPCTGLFWLKPEDATAYVRSHDEAVESLAKGGAKFPIMFQCHKESQSPWKKP